jgi:hypothetical protein
MMASRIRIARGLASRLRRDLSTGAASSSSSASAASASVTPRRRSNPIELALGVRLGDAEVAARCRAAFGPDVRPATLAIVRALTGSYAREVDALLRVSRSQPPPVPDDHPALAQTFNSPIPPSRFASTAPAYLLAGTGTGGGASGASVSTPAFTAPNKTHITAGEFSELIVPIIEGLIVSRDGGSGTISPAQAALIAQLRMTLQATSAATAGAATAPGAASSDNGLASVAPSSSPSQSALAAPSSPSSSSSSSSSSARAALQALNAGWLASVSTMFGLRGEHAPPMAISLLTNGTHFTRHMWPLLLATLPHACQPSAFSQLCMKGGEAPVIFQNLRKEDMQQNNFSLSIHTIASSHQFTLFFLSLSAVSFALYCCHSQR